MLLTEKRIIYTVIFAVVTIFLGCKGNDLDKVNNVSFGINLIENSSFEKWADSIPDGWKERVIDEVSSEGEAVNRFKRSSEDNKSGNYSCCFEGQDTTNKWVAFVQTVPVVGGSDLIISSDIKTKNLRGISAYNTYSNLFVCFLDKDAKRLTPDKKFGDVMMHRNVGTKSWHHSNKKITVPAGARFAEIGLLSTMSGVICFDNVEAVLREKTPWIKKDTKYITFYYLPKHPFPEGAIEKETGAIENYAERINLGKISKKINYYYYSNEEDFKRINVVENYYQGVNWGKREIHTMKTNEDLVVTHMLLYDFGFPPLGLAKGLVFYLRSYEHGWDPHQEAKEDLLKHKLQPLYKSVSSEELQSADPSTIIPAWTSFCTYLIGEYGLDKFLKLYKESNKMTKPEPFAKLFEKIYEREFQKVDMDWRLFVMRYKPKGKSVPMP